MGIPPSRSIGMRTPVAGDDHQPNKVARASVGPHARSQPHGSASNELGQALPPVGAFERGRTPPMARTPLGTI